MAAKEAAMIELTKDQQQVLDTGPEPITALDPRTGQKYLLIRRETYEKMRAFFKPFARGWDNLADDGLTREPS
jgi:hypothetical protein